MNYLLLQEDGGECVIAADHASENENRVTEEVAKAMVLKRNKGEKP